jgi:hypothetical protein
MSHLLTAILLITLFLVFSFSNPVNAGVDMTDAGAFFNDEAYGFEGETRLTCQTKGEDVANTITAIIAAAESENTLSLFSNSLRFAHIGGPFIDECGRYMNNDKRDVLTALISFSNNVIGEDSGF